MVMFRLPKKETTLSRSSTSLDFFVIAIILHFNAELNPRSDRTINAYHFPHIALDAMSLAGSACVIWGSFLEKPMKTCRKCGQEKNVEEFYVHQRMTDGRLNMCKECVKCRVKDHRTNNVESIREYDRNRSKTEKRRKHISLTSKLWRKNNPDKLRAHSMVGYAIAKKKIIKGKCQVCGKDGIIHGHHDDYTKPIDVRWLCPVCHSATHRKKTT
jgi:hypothetical protein